MGAQPFFILSSQRNFLSSHVPKTYLPISPPHRSNRQRLRPLQIRRFCPKSLRRPQLPLVRRPPHLLRTQPRHRLPGSLLPAQQRRRLREGRVLQLHTSEGAERGVGSGVGVGDEEVVEGEGEGREEHVEESESGTDEEEVLR